MIKQFIKGICWPRGKTTAKEEGSDKETECFRYVIVSMIITDKPLDGLEGNEFVLEGEAYGIAESLEKISKRKPNRIVGEASEVLLSLKEI